MPNSRIAPTTLRALLAASLVLSGPGASAALASPALAFADEESSQASDNDTAAGTSAGDAESSPTPENASDSESAGSDSATQPESDAITEPPQAQTGGMATRRIRPKRMTPRPPARRPSRTRRTPQMTPPPARSPSSTTASGRRTARSSRRLGPHRTVTPSRSPARSASVSP